MTLDDHAEDLASALGVDKQEVKADLESLVSYSVPVEEAKDSLRRKYGDGSDGDGPEPETKSIAEITTDDANVTLTGRVLTVGTRSIRYQGDDLVIREGKVADGSGTISYTAWEEFGLEPGDTVTLVGAGVREWNDQPELNLGSDTGVEFEEEVLNVAHAIGGEADLEDLEPGDRGATIEVRVEEVEEKTIDGRDGETDILSGVLADESARLPFTDWDPHDALRAGASVGIADAYVREFRGVASINVSEFSTVEELDTPVEPGDDAARMGIREAVATGGVFDVAVVGDLLAVREGSGLIQRCPECGRVVERGQCRSHGDVEGEDDLRVKAILDDGTDSLTVVLGEDLTAAVYGGGMEAAREQARDAMDQTVVADTIREAIVGREFVVRGSLGVDDYGANLDARSFVETDDEPEERARSLLAAVESEADETPGTTATDGGHDAVDHHERGRDTFDRTAAEDRR